MTVRINLVPVHDVGQRQVVAFRVEHLQWRDERKSVSANRCNRFAGAFGDGSVKFISNTINLDVWRSLSTAYGKEPIASNF